MDTEIQIKEKAREIDAVIEKYLPKEEGAASTVMSAMNYSIHVGGKRLRPMMMQETYRLFGASDQSLIEPFMAAIEMIHTYSLCHDDLPAMDNDMMRRGKKSTHAEYGEAMGILAGDALLNYAFEIVLESTSNVATDMMPRVFKALRILANKAGIYGMIAGQVVDIESEDKRSEEITMDTIKFIHENKTAAMIESSLMIGAVLAGAGEEETRAIERMGSDVGLAFQIRDDILDITGSDETLGKPTGSDEKNGKATYVTLVGLERAKEDVAALSERALSVLENLPGDGSFLAGLIRYLIDRES